MSEETKPPLNLFQRINAVRAAVGYVQKDKNVSTGASGSYKAVTHDMVTAITREHMVKHGIVCFPYLVESLMNPPAVDKDGVPSKQMRYEATYDFTFVNADIPDDRLTIRIQAHAMDNADKAPGKALSYAKKYAVLKLFELETGEDEEGRVADHTVDEGSLAEFISSLSGAKTMDELKQAYETAYPIAEKAKDTEAMRVIIRAKNARGKVLLAEQAK